MVGLLCITIMSAGCEKPESGATSSSAASPDVPSVASAIEGFPVPATAILSSGPTEATSSFTGFQSTTANYSAPDMTSTELGSWYAASSIYQTSFGDWKWCESFQDGGTWDMWWRLAGSNTSLGISASGPSGAKGVAFIVTKETGDSAPCRGSTSPTTRGSATTGSPATTAAKPKIMPDVVGLNLQQAQDLIQSSGNVFSSSSYDCTGAGRSQIVDSNWIVVRQSPSPGSSIESTKPNLGAVKKGEPLSCQ
jgi:hypothetical protein